MSALELVRVDPHTELFDAWHATYAEALRHVAGEYATVWQLEELRVMLAEPAGGFAEAWAGVVDGRVVSTGWLRGSLIDNLDSAEVEVTTAVADRGRGYAAAVLARLEAAALERGRTRALAEITWPFDDPAGERSADLRWARSHGFGLGLVDVQRRLAVPVDAALLDALAAEAAPHHRDYELRSFLGPVPDDVVEGWAALTATLMTEAPMGEIAREVESADVGALREREAVVAKQGRLKVNTAALSASGEVVAYSDIGVTVHEPERAYQWGTLVRGDHRGHRLGLAVKVANLRLLQDTQPGVTTVVTFNAEVNDHMIGVNERLGFVPVQRLGELHKQLTSAEPHDTRL